ncbi:MAG: HflK protein [Alphaproteobacteria bacterium RIFOXYD12_FULL_60_8]|nr:MAG: HflK protein [Alphaproteobacteria bacterium RIFOXYD12_FULL_60_8]
MAWNNQGGGPWGGGGSGGGRGPSGGGSGGGPKPPDLEDLLRRSQERVRRFIPGGSGGPRGLALILVAAVGLWALTGFYRVQPSEEGVALLFGKYVKTTSAGLNYWFPAPFGEIYRPNVTQINQITIGYRAGRGEASHDVPQEGLMLTGDQNIINIDFVVQWRIKSAADYLFNIRNPEETIKAASESAMREVIGLRPLEDALTNQKLQVEQQAKDLLQTILDNYRSGVMIQEVKLQQVDPPQPVIDAFNDVQRAKQDQERLQNEALTYRNDIVPRAKGEAERQIQNSTAFMEKVIKEAEGEAKGFISVYDTYKNAKDVTTRRIYLEHMQEILAKADKVIVDGGVKGAGVVPYLPLPEVQKRLQGGGPRP